MVCGQDVVDALRKEERAEGRGRKWRGAFRRIQQQLLELEHDSKALELVFPQARPLRPTRTFSPQMSSPSQNFAGNVLIMQVYCCTLQEEEVVVCARAVQRLQVVRMSLYWRLPRYLFP